MAANGSQERPTEQQFPVLRKILVSVIIGGISLGISFVVGLLVHANDAIVQIIAVCVSIFVAGIAFIAQFMNDIDNRVNQAHALMLKDFHEVGRRFDTVSQEIRDEFQTVETGMGRAYKSVKVDVERAYQVTKLFAAIVASNLDTEKSVQLINDAITAGQSSPLIAKFAEHEIDRLLNCLHHLATGDSLTYDGEDRDWLLGLTRSVRTSIDATSLSSVDGGLWTSDLGERYLDAQEAAIRRGVHIRRIFIIDGPDHHTGNNIDGILNMHLARGIKVKTMERPPVTATQRLFFDFIVMDGLLTYESQPAPGGGPKFVRTTLNTDRTLVDDRIGRFEHLWNAAQKYPPTSQTA